LENGDEEETVEIIDSKYTEDKLKLAEEDYSLYEALNLLKGIHLVKNMQNK